jgi:hypothetical protein
MSLDTKSTQQRANAAASKGMGSSQPFQFDTATGSLLHGLASRYLSDSVTGTPSVIKTCCASILITYTPLFVTALANALPIAGRTTGLRLPFLFDWNVAFMFLVTLPVLVTLTVRDQSVLASSLRRVQTDEVLVADDDEIASLCSSWSEKFRRLNFFAQICGLLAGGILAWFNYLSYISPHVGFWIAAHGKLLPVGFFCGAFISSMP